MMNLARSIPEEALLGNGREFEPHVTVRYGIVDEDFEGIKGYLSTLNPFEISFGALEVFPPTKHSDGAAVLIAPVISNDLPLINTQLALHGNFKKADFEYHPHATIAYMTPVDAEMYAGSTLLVGHSLMVSNITVCAADEDAERDVVQFGPGLTNKVLSQLLLAKFDDSEERDEHGRWTEGTGPSSLKEEPVGFKPSEKMVRAMASQNRCGAEKQRIADEQEGKVSRAVGIPRTKNNSAFDLRNDKVGVELKTMVDSKNGKITMSKDALARKINEAQKDKIKMFTVVADKRSGGGGTRYYYSRGVGSFRLGSMTPVTLSELKGKLR
jgi:2'-5' RNA ligase